MAGKRRTRFGGCAHDTLPAAALGLFLFSVATVERSVVTDGGYDRLYGFPAGWTVNAYYSSFAYDFFVLPLMLDVFAYIAVGVLLIACCRSMFNMRGRVGPATRIMSALFICGVIALQSLLHMDGRATWLNDLDYTTIERCLHLGTYP